MALDAAVKDVLVRFTFKRRKVDLPPDLRPDWRIATIVLLLKRCCHGGKSSLLRLHVLNWAIRSKDAQSTTLAFVDGKLGPESVMVRYDPALNRALDFAAGEGLVKHSGNRIILAAKGKTMAAAVETAEGLMDSEKEFVEALGRRLTEDIVKRLADRGGTVVAAH